MMSKKDYFESLENFFNDKIACSRLYYIAWLEGDTWGFRTRSLKR